MFADDTNVSTPAESLEELQVHLNSDLDNIHQWLVANKLTLNVSKTEYMIIGSHSKLSKITENPMIRIEETVTTELESKSEVEPNSKSQSNINDFLNPHVYAVKECNATEVEGSVHLSNRSNRMDTVPELPSATDIAAEVVKLMKEMKVDDTFEEKPKELLDKQQIANDLDEWRKIRSITELATQVPCLEFFYDEVMSESVTCCEVCFKASTGKENIKNMSPYEIARKKNPFNHGDPVTGIWNGKERTQQYLKGGNSSWRLLKSVFRSHLLGISNTSHGKHHYLAMKELEREQEYDCGVDIGQQQHSRKQMLAMLVAAEDIVDEKTTNVLKTELLCTQVYPHFFGVLDKGTVNRRTSQASYNVFMYNGKRCAYPVGVPLVYTRNNEGEESSDSEDENESEEEEEFPDVSGGNAPELASNFLNTIKLKLKLDEEDLTRYCGTSADSPYQAYEFGFTIQGETGQHRIPEELRFCQAAIWDATHLLNLAATDIKEETFGESQDFFTNFIKRANEFNHMMGTEKGFAQLELTTSLPTTATSLPTTADEGNIDHTSAAIVTTSSTPTTGASLSEATVQQIVSAVSQAVLASLNATGATSQSTSASETRELPVVASGIVSLSADATYAGACSICFTACFR
ncbi:Hypothetical predicted protein [Paramuricea clavata]|uniref:Uncharacterized protein n=1 Tax=Paramuricea clavata TaxID=317549 RepID=A0A7D9DBP3_PARCT|nr:Hypothetical predicted protein [Paramuricea clavata]